MLSSIFGINADARNHGGLTEANARRLMENAVRELPKSASTRSAFLVGTEISRSIVVKK
jgi:hypothetical protein